MDRILIIDNEHSIRDVFSLLLRSNGYDTHSVKTHDEAVHTLLNESFQLILADVAVPGMSFTNFILSLKNNEKHASTPVVAVTAVPNKIEETVKPLLAEIFEKPFSQESMLKMVERVITNK